MTLARPRVKIREGYSMFTCEVRGCTLRVLTPGGLYTDHKCPHAGGETRISWMSYGPSLLQQLWDRMDSVTASIIKGGGTVGEYDKGEARGIAFALSLYMVPHFRTSDDIVREAVKRHKMKAAGEEYETPGLGSRTYEPPPGENKLASRPAPAKMKIPDHLTPDDIQDIKNSAFPIEMLASTYDTTPPVIKAIKSQA